jgi:hypothetical protein
VIITAFLPVKVEMGATEVSTLYERYLVNLTQFRVHRALVNKIKTALVWILLASLTHS